MALGRILFVQGGGVRAILRILKTRFELISIEVEEELDSRSFLAYLLLSLAGLFCLALTILLAVTPDHRPLLGILPDTCHDRG